MRFGLRARKGITGRFSRGEDTVAKEGEADALPIRRCSLTPAAAARPNRPVVCSRALVIVPALFAMALPL
ncbi:MAG: hypothetical protein U1E05_06880, partial [Patescibacteria group bacterium]|nr:hypothetical protein [Patescibacteria group bacterium]